MKGVKRKKQRRTVNTDAKYRNASVFSHFTTNHSDATKFVNSSGVDPRFAFTPKANINSTAKSFAQRASQSA